MMSRSRKLRLENLESKNLLAGDVTAQLIGGDLVITGDLLDNQVRIEPDSSLVSPGVGEVTVRGIGTTTVEGGTSVSFSGAMAVTGDVILNFTVGGNNTVSFDKLFTSTDLLQLPGSIEMEGGAGLENLFVGDTVVAGNVIFTDTTSGNGDSFAGLERSEVGGNFTMTTASGAVSEIAVDIGSVVDGNVTLFATSSDVGQSFFGVRDSTIKGDARHFSEAASSGNQFFGATVEDDVILDLTEGEDFVTVADGNSVESTTIGDDLRIYARGDNDDVNLSDFVVTDDLRIFAGGGDDEVALSDFIVHDDVVFRGGSGDDLLEIQEEDLGPNTIGDDLYITGGEGIDDVGLEDVNIVDKLRISMGNGDDVVLLKDITVGRSTLVSLGAGLNGASVETVNSGRSLTIVGRGTNDIFLDALETSHFVTVITSNGDDIVSVNDVTTHSMLVSTHAGNDDVVINASTVDYLFVLLGSGDDVLTLQGVTVDRFALLSGGSGSGDDLLYDPEDNDINFLIDFAFEPGTV